MIRRIFFKKCFIFEKKSNDSKNTQDYWSFE